MKIKRTQIIELFCNIKATAMSFFSIMMFVALSVGIFFGISWSGPALQESANDFFYEGNFQNFEILFPYGFTDEDIDKLKDIEDVDLVETGYSSYQTTKINGKNNIVKVMSLTEQVNRLECKEGELPSKKNEIAVNANWAKKQELTVGDTITFKHDGEDEDGMEYLKQDSFVITALVESPAYLSYSTISYGVSSVGSGSIQCLMWLPVDSFDTNSFLEPPIAYIKSDELLGLSTSNTEYLETSSRIMEQVESLGDELSNARYLSIKNEAKAKLDEAREKLDSAKKAIEDGEVQIEEGKNKLETARRELTEGRIEIEKGRAQIKAGEKELAEGLETLTTKQAQYDQAEALYNKYLPLYEQLLLEKEKYDLSKYSDDYMIALPEYSFEINAEVTKFLEDNDIKLTDNQISVGDLKRLESLFNSKVEEAKVLLDSSKAQLDAGWSKYNEGLDKLNRSKKKLPDGERKAAEAEKQIADGEKLLAEKQVELEEARKEYDDGEKEYKKGQKAYEDISEYQWTVLSRTENGGVQELNIISDLTDNLRYSMALLFIIIGLLVSYSAVSRIVNDQIVSVGTKKALGLSEKEITISYLTYSGVAVLVGSILGLLIATFAIERILSEKIGVRFVTGPFPPYFNIVQAIILTIIELVLILFTTWFACRKTLKKQAVQLLKGVEPPVAKARFYEKWRLWEKLPLLTKTMINNCINDKKRVFGTLVGVAGCTALIVTSITVNNNIQASFTTQYEDVFHYDTIVRYKKNSEGIPEAVNEAFDDLGISGTPVHTGNYKLMLPNGGQYVSTVVVPFDDETFNDYFSIKPVGETLDSEVDNGVWVCVSYKNHQDAKVGDTIEIADSSGQIHSFVIKGFFYHYLLSYQIVMDIETYENVFETKCKSNAALVDSNGTETEELHSTLLDVKGVTSVKDDYGSYYNTFNEFAKVASIVIAVYLVLSVIMAVVVLLDLNAVFIEEKKRELIVLMINGFSISDAKKYIYRDTIVLTIMGIILGVIVGVVLGNVTIISIEPDRAFFVKGINWQACLIGVISSGLLSTIMSVISLRKISRFSLTDINKM